MQKDLQHALNFARLVAARFDQDRCMQIAASLTFTTLLSLIPLITIMLVLFSAFPSFEDLSIQIKINLLTNLTPEVAGKIITDYMQQFVESAANLTAVGIGFLALTAATMMLTIDHAFNTIWRVVRPRSLLKRLASYCVIITLAPFFIGASLSLTTWLVGLSMGYARQIPIFDVDVLKLLPVLFTTLAFAILFRLAPNRHVPYTHALVGAVVAAIVFESMNRAFGYYISQFATYKLVYGAFASVPIFLLWVYLSWLAILLGAVIAASLSYWRKPEAQNLSPAGQLLGALRVLKAMFEQGEAKAFSELSDLSNLGFDALEDILEKLAGAGIVRKAGRSGWLLACDTSHIRISGLLNLFVLDRDSLSVAQGDDPLQQWLADYAAQLEQGSSITLQELFARNTA